MRRWAGLLRTRAYAVVLVVVFAPLAAVWLAALPDLDSASRMRRAVTDAAAAVVAGNGSQDAVENAAREQRARVRLFDASGVQVGFADHEAATSLRDRAGDIFFGPHGAPRLDDYESALPRPAERIEVRAARERGRFVDCQVSVGGRLTVCTASARVGASVVVAERSSPRAIRALYDLRYPLLKLTLFMSALGLALAAWLVRTIVAPLERLRRAAGERAASPRIASPIPAPSSDEFGDLAAAFNELLASLHARVRQHEAFAADLAHELKNPVAAVLASAEALASAGPIDASRAERLSRALTSSGARLDFLVTQFLELARAEAGLVDEPRTAVDLGATVRGIRDTLVADARYSDVHFEIDGEAHIEGVATRIESALRNVMDNAASFAGSSGIVRVDLESTLSSVRVRVSDTGPGIAVENLPRVFERFFTTRPAQRGTGLGLAMARAITEAHGGTLGVNSPPARGATFTFEFPARAANA